MTGQNDSIAVGIPGSHGGGHIFFDGDFDFEGQVKAEVGNAEAADAEDFADQVTAVYNCAQGKGEIGRLRFYTCTLESTSYVIGIVIYETLY